jgi:hypothetical protein
MSRNVYLYMSLIVYVECLPGSYDLLVFGREVGTPRVGSPLSRASIRSEVDTPLGGLAPAWRRDG